MNPNSGSFMGPSTGQPSGTGSALMRLMQLRQQGASPNAIQNPGSSGYVAPAAAPTGNAINPSQIAQAGQQPPQIPQGAPAPAGMGSQAPVKPNANGVNMTFDPHEQALQVAMEALSNYIQHHGKSLMADHGVQEKEARAKVIAASANPSSSPVGA